MLFYLKSTDPRSYGVIKFHTDSPIGFKSLLFRIDQLSTIATFLITTDTDFITFTVNSEDITIFFENRCIYEHDQLPYDIQSLLPEGLHCDHNYEGTLTFHHDSQEFIIKDASHRAKLLTGLYYSELPMSSTNKQIIINSVPYICYGNNLFLRSNISSIAGFTSTDTSVNYLSLCYNATEMFIPGIPIITRHFGTWSKILPKDLTNFEFTLVDFQNEPVILKAPMYLIMELIREDECCTQFVLTNQF